MHEKNFLDGSDERVSRSVTLNFLSLYRKYERVVVFHALSELVIFRNASKTE